VELVVDVLVDVLDVVVGASVEVDEVLVVVGNKVVVVDDDDNVVVELEDVVVDAGGSTGNPAGKLRSSSGCKATVSEVLTPTAFALWSLSPAVLRMLSVPDPDPVNPTLDAIVAHVSPATV